jgi:GNAT superfamily N-acetyltransferase
MVESSTRAGTHLKGRTPAGRYRAGVAWDGFIRDGRPEEAPALEALQLRASVVYESDRDAVLAHPEVVALPPGALEAARVRVAEEPGGVVGFSVVLEGTEGAWELDGLFVEPGRWRQGIGAALVTDVAGRAVGADRRRLDVVANPNALGFYLAAGFEELGEVATQFGPGIRMTLRLC